VAAIALQRIRCRRDRRHGAKRTLVSEGRLKAPATFDADLAALASGAYTERPDGRTFFVFSGHVLGDLAVAAAIYRRALELGIGVKLLR
jgi:ornithine cyclodeaminase/alanine dehydrogenase-like protein (mu-crystallin family)